MDSGTACTQYLVRCPHLPLRHDFSMLTPDHRIGDSRHVMTYTIGAGRAFNMVLSHPDTSDPATWDAQTALQAMKTEFQGWDSV